MARLSCLHPKQEYPETLRPSHVSTHMTADMDIKWQRTLLQHPRHKISEKLSQSSGYNWVTEDIKKPDIHCRVFHLSNNLFLI